jgi:hypothetical protein
MGIGREESLTSPIKKVYEAKLKDKVIKKGTRG